MFIMLSQKGVLHGVGYLNVLYLCFVFVYFCCGKVNLAFLRYFFPNKIQAPLDHLPCRIVDPDTTYMVHLLL